jgi:hypothetical protein
MKEGVLRLEEIHDHPQVSWHFADPTLVDDPRSRFGLVRLLTYEVLIHLDSVTNFRPPVDDTTPWPMHHSFRWWLGRRVDWMLRQP